MKVKVWATIDIGNGSHRERETIIDSNDDDITSDINDTLWDLLMDMGVHTGAEVIDENE